MKHLVYIVVFITSFGFAQSGFEKGNVLYQKGQYEQAIQAYESVLDSRQQSAELYFNLGNYMGNNYESAVITAQNALKKYPSTSYREELSMIILEAKYQQAVQSVFEKKIERYRSAIDEYYNYVNEFPDGKLRKQAERIFNESKKIVKD